MSLIELHEVPFVKYVPHDGRSVLLSVCYDHAERRWTSYQPYQGKVLALRVSNLVEGLYVSTAPVDAESDIQIELTEFIFQHFSLRSLSDLNDRLERDLINALASIHKYFVILHHSNIYDDQADIGPNEF